MTSDNSSSGLSRRRLLRQAAATGAGLGAFSFGGTQMMQFMPTAFAQNQPPLGTWPDGSSGPTVNIGAAVPRTGAYAVQGEDELKGWQLAVEHINNGDPLLKQIAPKVTKGVLGKTGQPAGRRQRRQAERRGAGAADLHQPEQDHPDDRARPRARSRWRSTTSPSARRFSMSPASRAPTTPPARTASATASARTSTARPRRTRSARCC